MVRDCCSGEFAIFVFYPEETLEGLVDLDELGTIDMLIVDEAQDLMQDSYLDVFNGLLEGGLHHGSWRFFVDPVQNIFRRDACSWCQAGDGPSTGRLPTHGQLPQHPTDRRTTSLLADVELAAILRVEGHQCEVIWNRDPSDMRRQLGRYLNRLLSGGIGPGDIVVLGPRRLENSSIHDGLNNVPYPIDDVEFRTENAATIAYSTIAGFKGLEADGVVLIDVQEILSDQARSQAYVGMSRARALLAIFLAESEKDDYEELARRFGERVVSTRP